MCVHGVIRDGIYNMVNKDASTSVGQKFIIPSINFRLNFCYYIVEGFFSNFLGDKGKT